MRKSIFLIFITSVCVLAITVASVAANKNSVKPATVPTSIMAPPITWASPEVNVSLPTGQMSISVVTFWADRDLQNVQLNVIPGISKFVTVQPGHLSYVKAGDVYSVKLTFLVPDGIALGRYDGTVHIGVGMRTLPETLKVSLTVTSSPTAAWPRFINSVGGYEIKYPPTWNVQQLPNSDIRLSTDSSTNAAIDIIRVNNPEKLTPLEYLKKQETLDFLSEGFTEFGHPGLYLESAITIPVNGLQALKYSSSDGFTESSVMVPHWDHFLLLQSFTLKDDPTLEETLYLIISTLRF